jgi:nicotinamide-nucleotide amidase
MAEPLPIQPKTSTVTGPGESAPEKVDFTRIDEHLVRLAACVLSLAQKKNLSVVTAESCTAGLIAAVLSEAPGASTHLQGGFVTYTKEQKTAVLGVPPDLLAEQSAVCAAVARCMAEGALRYSTADVAVAVTGVAGPEPDEDGNPVGLLYLAGLRRDAPPIEVERQFGAIGRSEIRSRAVAEAMTLLAATLALDPEALTPARGSPPAAGSR